MSTETVNGVTFDPNTLFFVSVGMENGETFEDESGLNPSPASYAEAEDHARRILKRAPLVYCVRIMTAVTDELNIQVGTVWEKDK